MATEAKRMRQLNATQAEYEATNPQLLDGEIAFSSDRGGMKAGPGNWVDLPYLVEASPQDGGVYGHKNGTWAPALPGMEDYSGDLDLISLGTASGAGVQFYRLTGVISNAWPSGGLPGDFVLHMEYSSDTIRAMQIGYSWAEGGVETTAAIYTRWRQPGGGWSNWLTQNVYQTEAYSGSLNAIAADGSYSVATPLSDTVSDAWMGASSGDVVQSFVFNADNALQIGYEGASGVAGQVHMRSKHNGVWEPWYASGGAGGAVTEADIVDLNRIRWRSVWSNVLTYEKNDMVIADAKYLAVATTQTTESPIPTELGSAFYLVPSAPTWASGSFPGSVTTAVKYKVPTGKVQQIKSYRFWVPVADPSYSYIVSSRNLTDPENPVDRVLFSGNGALLQVGWNEIEVDAFYMFGGSEFILALETLNVSETTTVSSDWLRDGDGKPEDADPTFWRSERNNDEVGVNKTSLLGDESAQLAQVVSGTTLIATNKANIDQWDRYYITAVADLGGVYQYETILLGSGPLGSPDENDTCELVFEIPTAGDSSYVLLGNHFDGNPDATGIVQEGNGTPVEDGTAYGVDVSLQEFSLASDWDIAAISGGGAIGGSADGGSGDLVSVGPVPPTDATAGALWACTVAPIGMYTLYDDGGSTQWAEDPAGVFPATPSDGQTHSAEGASWQYLAATTRWARLNEFLPNQGAAVLDGSLYINHNGPALTVERSDRSGDAFDTIRFATSATLPEFSIQIGDPNGDYLSGLAVFRDVTQSLELTSDNQVVVRASGDDRYLQREFDGKQDVSSNFNIKTNAPKITFTDLDHNNMAEVSAGSAIGALYLDADIDNGFPATARVALRTGLTEKLIAEATEVRSTVPLTVIDGTAGSPGLRFEGDNGLGIYRANDVIYFASDGIWDARIDPRGTAMSSAHTIVTREKLEAYIQTLEARITALEKK